MQTFTLQFYIQSMRYTSVVSTMSLRCDDCCTMPLSRSYISTFQWFLHKTAFELISVQSDFQKLYKGYSKRSFALFSVIPFSENTQRVIAPIKQKVFSIFSTLFVVNWMYFLWPKSRLHKSLKIFAAIGSTALSKFNNKLWVNNTLLLSGTKSPPNLQGQQKISGIWRLVPCSHARSREEIFPGDQNWNFSEVTQRIFPGWGTNRCEISFCQHEIWRKAFFY